LHVHALVPQAIQYLTVDYGREFCDYYGARCNRHMIETCRVKSVTEIPKSVSMSWVQYKMPLDPRGAGASSKAT